MNASIIFSAISLALSIGAIIYKTGRLTEKMNSMQEEIDETKKDVTELQKQQVSDISEIKNVLTNLSVSMARMETSLKYIEKSINEAQ